VRNNVVKQAKVKKERCMVYERCIRISLYRMMEYMKCKLVGSGRQVGILTQARSASTFLTPDTLEDRNEHFTQPDTHRTDSYQRHKRTLRNDIEDQTISKVESRGQLSCKRMSIFLRYSLCADLCQTLNVRTF